MAVHLGLEVRIGLGLVVGLLEIEDQRHQRLGDEAAAIEAEMAALVRPAAIGIQQLCSGRVLMRLWPVASDGRLGGPNEASHEFGILVAGSALDAGGDIDQRRAGRPDRLADRLRRKTA